MNLPKLPNIVDLVELQNTVALLLCSDDRLDQIPILTEVKLNMDSDIVTDVLWTMPRNCIEIRPGTVELFQIITEPENNEGGPKLAGPMGAGLLVEMPEGKTISRNVEGPPFSWKIRVVAFEERNANLTPGVGTFIMAEQLAQVVIDALQLQHVYPFGALMASANAVAPARDWEQMKPGIACWGATVEVENGRKQTPRSTAVAMDFADGLCTLTCTDPAAMALYTMDGSVACKANPSAMEYAGPFAVGSGMLIKASTWKPGFLPSSVIGKIAP